MLALILIFSMSINAHRYDFLYCECIFCRWRFNWSSCYDYRRRYYIKHCKYDGDDNETFSQDMQTLNVCDLMILAFRMS